jgi:insertion element IS1 protein InsB
MQENQRKILRELSTWCLNLSFVQIAAVTMSSSMANPGRANNVIKAAIWSAVAAPSSRLCLPRIFTRGETTDCRDGGERHIAPAFHTVGKAHTQTIERKHWTLRTRIKRLARKTICFSKSVLLHDVVIGLFINRYEFGVAI